MALLRVGLISANWGAKCHLPAWRSVPRVDVVAICTSRPETASQAAELFGVDRPFHDYREMVNAPDIDLIDIGTKPPLRYEMMKAALNAGKHVYAGVPFTATLEQAEELGAIARERSVIGASDAYFQYIPAHLEMKRRIEENEIGEILSISLDLQINLFNPTSPDYPYFWFADRRNGASALRNLGTHAITLLTSLFGPVSCAIGTESIHLPEWRSQEGAVYATEVPDTASALLRFAMGPVATVNCSWIDAGAVGWRLDVHGSKGRLTARHEERFPNHVPVRLLRAMADNPHEEEITISSEFTACPEVAIDSSHRPLPCYPMALSFARLKRAIEGIGRASPNLNDALHTERVLAAISRSTESLRWETVTHSSPNSVANR